MRYLLPLLVLVMVGCGDDLRYCWNCKDYHRAGHKWHNRVDTLYVAEDTVVQREHSIYVTDYYDSSLTTATFWGEDEDGIETIREREVWGRPKHTTTWMGDINQRAEITRRRAETDSTILDITKYARVEFLYDTVCYQKVECGE